MSQPIISARSLGKQYRLGSASAHDTFRDQFAHGVRGLFSRKSKKRMADDKGEAFWALKNVSFDVQRGEVIGIIGRNGAGKSTLLKILSQITEPTEGEVRVRGRVASLLEVGTGFHPELSGRENIFLNGSILGMSRAEMKAKFDEIVAFAEVERFLDTPVKRYSSGMYVRLAFAVAAHLEPEILIVDEVLSVGDSTFRKKCLGKMGEVAKGGRTVLFVSHNISAISLLCSRCLLLDGGKVLQQGETKEVVSEYQLGPLRKHSSVFEFENVRRTGSGRARFQSLRIIPYDDGREPLPAAITGCNLDLIVTLLPHETVSSVNVAVIVYDTNGYRLIDANTALSGQMLDLNVGTPVEVSFSLQNLLLGEGMYVVGLWMGVGGIEEVDHVDFAASFEMVPDIRSNLHTETFPSTYKCKFEARVS